jgi:hypothetical protein
MHVRVFIKKSLNIPKCNKKSQIEEEQITQSPKERGRKDKQ